MLDARWRFYSYASERKERPIQHTEMSEHHNLLEEC